MTEASLKSRSERYRQLALSLVICLCCSTTAVTAAATTPVSEWEFSQEITPAQRQEVKLWLSEVQSGVNRLLGPSPDTYEMHIKTQASEHSPVPWAHTAKGPIRQVHLYLDTTHSWTDFRGDWTAAHELSHMLFPYVGEDRWFAEGLASYLQYQVMFASGHIDWESAVAKIEERFDRVKNSQVPTSWSVLKHNAQLNQQRDYPRLYWGGAAYFANVDRQLWEGHGMRLNQVLREYTQCCYQASRTSAMALLALFDEICEADVFLQTYRQEMLTDETPDTETLGKWLRANPPRLADD